MNKNKTAVMIANGYEDSLILPNQLVTFFNDLTVPKRLELRVGDHGGPENSGLQGSQNEVWDNATKWLDHFVRGVANGIQDQQPIQLKDAITNQWHAVKDAAALSTSAKLTLGAAVGSPETGALQVDATPAAWSRRITTGTDTSANSGSVQINNPRFVIPAGISIAEVNRTAGLVWVGAPERNPQLIAGQPHLHVTVTPSGDAATLFAYLYDVDPVSGGSLVTYAPYSLVGVSPGQRQTVDLDLATIAWTMPAGHHLALVVDTVDARYASRNPVGSSLTFSSSAIDPATFSLPSA
jgi:predicted acyl esterase